MRWEASVRRPSLIFSVVVPLEVGRVLTDLARERHTTKAQLIRELLIDSLRRLGRLGHTSEGAA